MKSLQLVVLNFFMVINISCIKMFSTEKLKICFYDTTEMLNPVGCDDGARDNDIFNGISDYYHLHSINGNNLEISEGDIDTVNLYKEFCDQIPGVKIRIYCISLFDDSKNAFTYIGPDFKEFDNDGIVASLNFNRRNGDEYDNAVETLLIGSPKFLSALKTNLNKKTIVNVYYVVVGNKPVETITPGTGNGKKNKKCCC